jgi:AcrR family transcriptional regulator
MTHSVTDAGPKPMRADARRNRERVLAAAEALFAEAGLSVQIEEVAERAGVGVGTVCRNFATKEALIDAVLTVRLGSVLARAEAAHADADPAAAFQRFVVDMAADQARHRLLAEEMAARVDVPAPAAHLKAAIQQAIADLVWRAQAAGALRPDIGPGDLALLFNGIAHAAALMGDSDPTPRERYVRIVLDGLRPLAASPLPGRPLDFGDLQRSKEALRRRNLARGA